MFFLLFPFLSNSDVRPVLHAAGRGVVRTESGRLGGGPVLGTALLFLRYILRCLIEAAFVKNLATRLLLRAPGP